MPHPFFNKPVRTIEQAVADLERKALETQDGRLLAWAALLHVYATTRKTSTKENRA